MDTFLEFVKEVFKGIVRAISAYLFLENLVVTKPFGDSLSCTYVVRKDLYFLNYQKSFLNKEKTTSPQTKGWFS